MPKTYSQEDLLTQLKKMVADSSQTSVAAQLGVTVQMVNDLVHGRRDISSRIAAVLGYEREIIFRKRAA